MSKAVEPIMGIVPMEFSDSDRQAIRESFDRKIAEASTLDELFDKPKPLGLEDIEGESVTVNAVRFLKGAEQYKDGLGVFCVMELSDGRVVTHGAETPLKILYKVTELGGFPIDLRFFRVAKQTAAGYRPWEVERA